MNSFSFLKCKTQYKSPTNDKLNDVKLRVLKEKLNTIYNKATFE